MATNAIEKDTISNATENSSSSDGVNFKTFRDILLALKAPIMLFGIVYFAILAAAPDGEALAGEKDTISNATENSSSSDGVNFETFRDILSALNAPIMLFGIVYFAILAAAPDGEALAGCQAIRDYAEKHDDVSYEDYLNRSSALSDICGPFNL